MTDIAELPSELFGLIVGNMDPVTRAMSLCISRVFRTVHCDDPLSTQITKEDKLLTISRDFIDMKTPNKVTVTFALWDTRMRVRCKVTRTRNACFYSIDDGNNTPMFSLKPDQDPRQMELFERHLRREGRFIVGATVYVKDNNKHGIERAKSLQRRLQSVFPTKTVFLYDNIM